MHRSHAGLVLVGIARAAQGAANDALDERRLTAIKAAQ
jgi:hypothetical protein